MRTLTEEKIEIETQVDWATEVDRDRPLFFLLGVMVLLGIYLRVVGMDGPVSLKWDEHHYVETARSYLNHTYAWNDHPPLSKLIIMAFMQVLGDGPIAWRLPSLLFGFLNIGLVGLLTYRVFSSFRAACMAAAFVSVDGFFIAYSRTALLDGMIVAFSLASILVILSGKTFSSAIWAGLLSGCALSFKLNGLVFVALSAAACLASPNLRRYTPLLIFTAIAVYFAQCSYALVRVGRPGDIASVIAENRAMLSSHLGYTKVHPYSSKWYTWFLPTKPIFIRRDEDIDGSVRALLALGNPLLWWAAIVAVFESARLTLEGGFVALWGALTGGWMQKAPLLRTKGDEGSSEGDESASGEEVVEEQPIDSTAALREKSGIFWLLACYAGPILFWVPSLRDAYIYHYFPAYAFALPLLAGGLGKAYARRPLAVLLSIVAALLVSVAYAPLWAELPITGPALSARLPAGWR